MYLALTFINTMLEFLKSMSEVLGTYILGPAILSALTYIGIKMVEKWREKKNHHSIKMTAEKNNKIQEILTEIRAKLSADRVYLTLFHNGNKYIDGSEILKMSRTNESVSPGISIEAHYYQDISISLVPDEMKMVTSPGVNYATVSSLEDGKFKRMSISRGVKAVARCGIRKSNDIIGFLGVDFDTDVNIPPNIEILTHYAGIIEQILSSYK